MKVTTDACLFGAWTAERVGRQVPMAIGMGVRRILDVGTGTGLLALMLAQKTDALVDTIEIDRDAFEQARENISASPWKDRINIHHGDARRFSLTSKYDVIISNPPFYENELKSPDEKKNLAHHGGLSLQEVLHIIKRNITEQGRFLLLLPYKRNDEIDRVINSNDVYIHQKTLVRQSPKHDFFRMMIEGSCRQMNVKTAVDEISIWNDQQQYTREFTELLKEYYLYL
jgi:tRNA1Val (adenine37-N6)-methyltransferase